MSFSQLFSFLERLQQHNHKEWMDQNRNEYREVREFFVNWLDGLNTTLAQIDDGYFDTPGKKAINRINNNLMFFPNKPVYKDYFSGGLDQVSKQGDFYIEIGLNECFAGGGYWHPSSKILGSIRDAIDYNGEEFQAILNHPTFKKTFGSMIEGERLKNPPKGFAKDHPYLELLKRKSYAAGCHFSKKEVLAPQFETRLIEVYSALLPFRRYLNEAITV